MVQVSEVRTENARDVDMKARGDPAGGLGELGQAVLADEDVHWRGDLGQLFVIWQEVVEPAYLVAELRAMQQWLLWAS